MAIDPSDVDQSSTYVNFSTPRRIMSPKSSATRRVVPELDRVDEDGELRAYKPIEPTRFVHFRVTSNDLPARSQDAEVKRDDLGAEEPTTVGERILMMSEQTPTASPRTNIAMPGHRSQMWPRKIQEKKAGSYTFDQVPTLTKTPWEMHRGESSPRRPRGASSSSKVLPRHIFEQLPPEVYHCILDQLERLYTRGPMVDVASLQTDLRNFSRIDKRWNRVSKEHMYRDLWLPGNRMMKRKKFSLQPPKSRLQMLLETLRRSPFLSTLVTRLRVPAELATDLDAGINKTSPGPVLEALTEIISLCANLEHLVGYVPSVGSASMGLIGALSTRPYLKSHAWDLDPKKAALPILGEFISIHNKWSHMEILTLSADKGVDLGLGSLSAILKRLPALKHLLLAGIHPADFNDATLFTMPNLKSLRLENLAGLSDQGVEQMAFSGLAASLQRLVLVGLELLSLQTVQTLLSHLTRLKRFIFVQQSSPEPLAGVDSSGKALSLESTSLRHLHWDCVTHGAATSSFAEAIAEGRFPRLRSVRVPCDYDGRIQAVCRPVPQLALTSDDIAYLSSNQKRRSRRSMRVARTQAQQRILQRREQPAVNVVVLDETNRVKHEDVIGSYLGDMKSNIDYQLTAEMEDNALPEFEDIVRPKSRVESKVLWEQKLDARILF